MAKSFRKVEIVGDKKLKNPFFVAKKLSDMGYKDVTLVVGSDRVKEIKKSMEKYINHPDESKAFYFSNFEVVSAGQRDPDSSGVAGVSGTMMRSLAFENDFDSFLSASPSGAKERDVKKIFDLLRKRMGVREVWDKVLEVLPDNASKFMVEREIFNYAPQDILENYNLYEQVSTRPTFLILTTKPTDGDYSTTTQAIMEKASEMDIPIYPVSVQDAYVATQDMNEKTVVIHNYYDNDSKIKFHPDNTVCLVRGSVMLSEAGMGILRTLQEYGVYCVNDINSMEFCRNKFTTALSLEKHKINSPKTALLSSVDSIDLALKKVGGKFPVVIKTISGAEGIGVSIVDSYQSLKSVLQSLWKHEAELIIQEYIVSDFDVRSVVVHGEIVASMKRLKGDKDFRTNKSLGNDSEDYKLSKEEEKIIKRAFKISGCDVAGVDHLVRNGKPMVLEVNGSPGFSAESYTDQETGEVIGGGGVIESILKYFSEKSNWRRRSNVIGIEEPINVKPFGKMKAKSDTGNYGINAIDANDVKINGKTVSFLSNGERHKEKIVDFIKINIGSDVIEKRPVVALDTEFYGKDLGKVLYSLADRNSSDCKVLLSKDFLSKQGYMVDVNRSYVTNIVDINENFERSLKGDSNEII